ncbi:MAG TPA: serine/threonine-protein kinase, partial [Gemmatimonadaceae bacterium]
MRLFADRYALERVVGQGATATVHLAKDTRAGVSVAVKMLRPELAQSGAADRFLREIERTSALSHPGILPVLDSGEYEGQLYFTLPYMEQGTLRQRLKRQAQLGIDESLEIVTQLADALDHAHRQGVVHRDVKPENVLFSGDKVFLGDFGIARALQTVYGDGSTSSATIRGTPAYMSPEQAAGSENLDGRSDVFSLACVAYEMITGMQAFMGPTPESVVAQRFAFTPREIRVYRPTVSLALDRALNRAFALSAADRYPTAGEFAAALHAASLQADPPRQRVHRRASPTVIAAVIVVVASLTYATATGRMPWQFGSAVDTTRVLVLPFDGSAPTPRAEDMLAEGLQRYRGLHVVESFAASDAIRRRGDVKSLADARALASGLGAGRYVRGRVGSIGNESCAYAALYDVESNLELFHARIRIGSDSPAVALASFIALADSLILRGAAEGAPIGLATGSLPAIQALVQGRSALGEWRLTTAESLFARALEFDPGSARANYWIAQVRSWQGQPLAAIKGNAERAASDTANLAAE